jgi:hypothetical protein
MAFGQRRIVRLRLWTRTERLPKIYPLLERVTPTFPDRLLRKRMMSHLLRDRTLTLASGTEPLRAPLGGPASR